MKNIVICCDGTGKGAYSVAYARMPRQVEVTTVDEAEVFAGLIPDTRGQTLAQPGPGLGTGRVFDAEL